jgi:single-strand DNA-binding protein
MLNKVMLVGHVGKDPDVRTTKDGRTICFLSLATTERWRDRGSGENSQKTEWHKIVIYNENLAKIAEQYCKKGALVYIEGQIETRKWTDKTGAERYSTEIVLRPFNGQIKFMSRQKADNGAGDRDEEVGRQPAPKPAARNSRTDLDDEVPF